MSYDSEHPPAEMDSPLSPLGLTSDEWHALCAKAGENLTLPPGVPVQAKEYSFVYYAAIVREVLCALGVDAEGVRCLWEWNDDRQVDADAGRAEAALEALEGIVRP